MCHCPHKILSETLLMMVMMMMIKFDIWSFNQYFLGTHYVSGACSRCLKYIGKQNKDPRPDGTLFYQIVGSS